MKTSPLRWLGRIFTLLMVIGLGVSGYYLYQLDLERKGLHAEVAQLNGRMKLLQKKYSEQKAQAAAMLRGKQAAESRARATAAELEEAREQVAGLEKRLVNHDKELAKLRQEHDQQLANQKKRYAKLRTSYTQLRAESQRIIKEKNGEITTLTSEKHRLTASLQQETFQHKRCRKHNAKLVDVADELVAVHEGKGEVARLGSIDPFTQINRVELEHMCQEYRARIDEGLLRQEGR